MIIIMNKRKKKEEGEPVSSFGSTEVRFGCSSIVTSIRPLSNSNLTITMALGFCSYSNDVVW